MKALVYHGAGAKAWETVPDPKVLAPTDAIVRMDTTTICGTDLHILKGDVATVAEGRVLGHEGVGTIVDVGAAVANHKVGDRVIVSCISSCAVCSYCRKGLPSHCIGMGGIGWVLGHLIDGTQAEYVRTPFADTSLHQVPESLTNEQAAMVSDIYPTGFEIGVQYGDIHPGDVVAVIGAGPVGLAAIATAKFYGPAKVIALDLGRSRLDRALAMGADVAVATSDAHWVDQVLAHTDGLGVDVAIEAVGIPDTLRGCVAIVRPGGHVANVGVHGSPVELPLDTMWIDNLRMTTGLVNATSSQMLLSLMEGGRLHPEEMVTHRFTFATILDAYDTFAHALDHDALKVAIHRE